MEIMFPKAGLGCSCAWVIKGQHTILLSPCRMRVSMYNCVERLTPRMLKCGGAEFDVFLHWRNVPRVSWSVNYSSKVFLPSWRQWYGNIPTSCLVSTWLTPLTSLFTAAFAQSNVLLQCQWMYAFNHKVKNWNQTPFESLWTPQELETKTNQQQQNVKEGWLLAVWNKIQTTKKVKRTVI